MLALLLFCNNRDASASSVSLETGIRDEDLLRTAVASSSQNKNVPISTTTTATNLPHLCKDEEGGIVIHSVPSIKKEKTCAWAGRGDGKRKKWRCSIPEVIHHCPMTCGICTSNDDSSNGVSPVSRILSTSYSCPGLSEDPVEVSGKNHETLCFINLNNLFE